jgi:hypothetical protein
MSLHGELASKEESVLRYDSSDLWSKLAVFEKR